MRGRPDMVGIMGPWSGVLEESGIVAGLVVVQIMYAANSELLSHVMSLGVDAYSFIILFCLSTFLLLTPLSVYFERTKWPKRFSSILLIQLLLISLAGITLHQTLFLKGIKLTSPAMGTAMPNLAPAITFVIAWAFRLESVKLGCIYSRVKIVGTLLCVLGAFLMSIMNSATAAAKKDQSFVRSTFDKEKLIGCIYLMASILASSASFVMQAAALVHFPAPMSLCAVMCIIGSITTAIVELILEHKVVMSWPLVSVGSLIRYSFLCGALAATCLTYYMWAITKRGPVFVSMFGPVGAVISVIISLITLRKLISIGSLAGMLIMFAGLYMVLWAKKKEGSSDKMDAEPLDTTECDMESPLLS